MKVKKKMNMDPVTISFGLHCAPVDSVALVSPCDSVAARVFQHTPNDSEAQAIAAESLLLFPRLAVSGSIRHAAL